MRLIVLAVLVAVLQSCVSTRPLLVNTYKDQSYSNLSNFTFSLVKDEKSNPEIWTYIENNLQKKGYFRDNQNYDLAVFYKVFNEKTKLIDVDFVSSGNILSKKYTSGKSMVVQIMDAKTKEVFYRGTCGGLPNSLSKNQMKAIVDQALKNLDDASGSHISFVK